MRKARNLIIFFILSVIVFCIPTIVNAQDTFTTNDGIIAKKVVNGTGGSIELRFSNIPLREEGNYTWAIGRNTNPEEVEKWYTLGDFSEKNKTAIITLTPEDSKVFKILRETNTAWIFIKDNANNTFVVNALKVDLTLPLLKAFNITEESNSIFRCFLVKNVYNIDNLYYNIQKITDEQVIKNYKEAKINGTPIENIAGLATIDDVPQENWNVFDYAYPSVNEFEIKKKPTEPGLYYVWVKGKDSDSKMVYGYYIFGLDNVGPTVTSINVNSPVSGTYKTPQTVTIRVNFNETITGTSAPTLKIKFGDSAERSLTNGTIKSNYIEYTYNIQDSDNGQLSTISLLGGTIKDADNNEATLSCPIITGYTIKANTEGTIKNETENQDKTNIDNKENPENVETPNKEETKKDDKVIDNQENSNQQNENKQDDVQKNETPVTEGIKEETKLETKVETKEIEKAQPENQILTITTSDLSDDKTTSTTKLPKTGISLGFIIASISIFIFAGFMFVKYRKLRDV